MTVVTLAGSSTNSGHTDGPAINATFAYPTGITFNTMTNDYWISDTYNYAIRILNMTSMEVSTPFPSDSFYTIESMDFFADGSFVAATGNGYVTLTSNGIFCHFIS